MTYRFHLLRYSPNRLSEEFYNIAVLLYDDAGRLLDASFAPDFTRLRSNPLADLPFLAALKQEFENRRLAGETFSQYVEELAANASSGVQLSEEKFFEGGGAPQEAIEQMDRLTRVYLVTPRRSEIRPAETLPGTRRWILGRMRQTFDLYHLTGRLESDVPVGSYVSPRFPFHVDYACKPNGVVHYLHALSLRHDLAGAGRLCFVYDRIRAQAPAKLTAVVADDLPQDTHALLQSSQITPWPVSRLDDLALAVRDELGL
ncbi:MAG TPA: DUF3037 domain-containing protein [Bryobacterales bacterium]|nr:DUF3037 domain-containing protein [Bryobacterales bacterium]